MIRDASKASLLLASLFAPWTAPGTAWAQAVSFTAQGGVAVGGSPQSVAAGDFNGDGAEDLATANRGSSNVSVLLGNGDGTFQAARNFPAGAGSLSVAVGDFNRDGKQDLATADYIGHTVSILLGNGDGTFLAPLSLPAGGTNPNCVAVGDFDRDGAPDLAVAIFGGNTPDATTLAVLLGNGDGTFQPARSFAVQRGPLWVAVGDFNGDGVPDLSTANFGFDTVSVLLGNGDGTFQPARNFPGGACASPPCGSAAVAVGDFNRDGAQDLAVTDYYSYEVAILLGNGDGTFGAARSFPVGISPVMTVAADFDGDGLPDLALANWNYNTGNTVSVLLGNGDGTFRPAQDFVAGRGVVGLVAGDLDGDGAPDLATADFAGNTGSVLLNRSAPPTRTLMVVKTGAGAGAVTSSPAGINCGATCSAAYPGGTSVTLTAAPAAGSTFTGWSGGGCSGTGTCVVTMSAAASVTAGFALQSFALTVSRAGLGMGTVTSSPAGINCGAACSATYPGGTSVTLTAAPAAGSTFTGWSGGGCSGSGSCVVTMSAAASVTAGFALQSFALTVSRAGLGTGTVTSSPAGINCGVTCSAAYPGGSSVTLTAAPAAGSTFTGWSGGGCTGTGACTVTVAVSTSVTAAFAASLSAPLLKWQYGGCTTWCQTGWYSSPAVADLDGDGQPEVVWGSYDVVALNGATGSLKWRGASGNRVWPAVAVADLTGNGSPEVIVGRSGDEVTVYNASGGVVWTRHPFGSGEVRSLAVADLEGDGQLEIVVGTTSDTSGARQMSVYEPNGAVRPGWPARHSAEPGYGGGMYNENLAVGDVNGDGFKEIFGPSGGHYITAVDRSGAQLAASTVYAGIDPVGPKVWSQVGVHVDDAVDLRGYANCGTEHRPDFGDSAPVVADVDGDGVPELIVVGNVNDCDSGASLYRMPFILRADRTRWSGSGFDWTVIPAPGPGSGPRSEDYDVIETSAPNPVVADLDGDGRMEILYPSYDGKVHAYWLDKTEHGSWPYTVPTTGLPGDDYRFASEPVVADLDGDGHAEVIFTSWPKKETGGVGQLHVLDYLGRELFRVSLPPALGGGWNGGLGAPTIANIDADADLEVVVGSVASGVVAYDLPNSSNARVLWGTGRGTIRRAGTR